MFKKPFKIKSNTHINGTERKEIKNLFCKNFPNVPEIEVTQLFNKKETINYIKAITHDNTIVQIYVIQKRPMIFILQEKVFPTVFLLWKIGNIVQSFTIHPQVMSFISSGADLMLPGVLTPPSHSGLPKYGNVSEGAVVCINLSNNKAAMAIGTSYQSSFDMERAAGKGKCIVVNHFYGDHLCTLEKTPIPTVPNLGIPDWLSTQSYNSDFPELGAKFKRIDIKRPDENMFNEQQNTVLTETKSPDENMCNKQQNTVLKENLELESAKNIQETETKENNLDISMDELLNYCFLTAIKYSKLTLPILISNFFKVQMLPVCPPGTKLDIKKTSYKKLKDFIDEMCKQEIIKIKEIKKGVEAIIDINKEHPIYNKFYLKPEDRPKEAGKEDSEIKPINTVEEFYIISQNVLPIFQSSGFNKGDTISLPNIKKYVRNYVMQHDCKDVDNPELVKPVTDILKSICKTNNSISWEEMFEKICKSMKNCHQVSSGKEHIFNKGKMSPITMSVSLRSGNKKVTIVDNLEVFGININEFAKQCQHGVAASTSITPKPPGKKCDQLMIQGNQILFVYKLLEEKYGIKKQYIKGLEHAVKKKK